MNDQTIERATGVQVGDLMVCCGDCDQYPCYCPQVDDVDMCVLVGIA